MSRHRLWMSQRLPPSAAISWAEIQPASATDATARKMSSSLEPALVRRRERDGQRCSPGQKKFAHHVRFCARGSRRKSHEPFQFFAGSRCNDRHSLTLAMHCAGEY